ARREADVKPGQTDGRRHGFRLSGDIPNDLVDPTFSLFDDSRAARAAAAVRDPRSGSEVIDLEPTPALRDIDGRRGGDGDGLVAADDGGAGGEGAAKPSHAAVVGPQRDR